MHNNIGIKVLSKACGVLPHVIRTWETRYQAFSPTRSEGGHRLYSESDLKKGQLLGLLINEGHTISNLAELSILELEGLVTQNPSPDDRANFGTNVSIKKLFHHLSCYEVESVVSEFEFLRLSCGCKEFIFKVILPVMQEIGHKVSKGIYSVTQEHIVSTIVRDQIGQLKIPSLGDHSRRIALATPDGNLHELSILIADIICRSNRVPTRYLGASHPASCLGEAMSALQVGTLVMGVVSSDQWNYEKEMINYLKKLDAHLKIKINVILGGGGSQMPLKFPEFRNIESVKLISNFQIFDECLMDYSLAV